MKIIFLVFILISVAGCTTINKAFFKTKRLDSTPYEKYVRQLVKEINERPNIPLTRETRAYFKLDDVEDYVAQREKLLVDLKIIGKYSHGFIKIAKTKAEPAEKIQMYQKMVNNVVKEDNPLGYTKKLLEEFNEKIKSSETILDVLELALPLLDEMADNALSQIKSTNKKREKAYLSVQTLIEQQFDESNNFATTSMVKRQKLSRSLDAILRYRWNTQANKKLELDEDVIHALKIKSSALGDDKYIVKIEKRIADRLAFNTEILHNLKIEIKIYLDRMETLNAMNKGGRGLFKKLDQALNLWKNGNKKIAAGVIDKAEVFDLMNPGAELGGITKNAINKISPF